MVVGFCVNFLDVTPTESLGPSALCGSHPHHFLFDKLLPLIGGIIHRHSSYASSVHSVDILLTLIKNSSCDEIWRQNILKGPIYTGASQ